MRRSVYPARMEADRTEAITALLVRAEAAHATFERTELNGVYDRDWPSWYATYAVDHGLGEMLGHDVAAEEVATFLDRSYADFERIYPKPESWAAYTARRIATEL